MGGEMVLTMTDIIILGIKGMGLDIVDTVEAMAAAGRDVRVLGFLDDDPAVQGTFVGGYPVLGRLEDAPRFEGAQFINGVGSPASYRRKPAIVSATGLAEDGCWAVVVHPTSVVSSRAMLGAGTAILSLCNIAADARVGRHVMVLPHSTVSHETVVQDFVTIASGVCIAGRCEIGMGAYLGSNCGIREGIRIGARALVGMGAVVVRDVPDDVTVLGNPARVYAGGRPSSRI
jgi:sugar O-acyltransferase (sialic acid O-acetyltransferase NeuD family)